MRNKTCLECPYKDTRTEVKYEGNTKADIMIVGEAPGFEEERGGRPFIGRSGTVLQKLIESVRLTRSDVFIANACRCRIDKDTDSTGSIGKALACCRPNLATAIEGIKPRLIVALGNFALRQLVKKQQITANRGRVFQSEWGIPVLATVHPAYVLRGCTAGFPEIPVSSMGMKERMIFEDFAQIPELLGSKVKKVATDYSTPLQSVAKHKLIAFDYETTGLDIHDPNVNLLCGAVTGEAGKVFAFPTPNNRLPAGFKKLLANPKVQKVVASRPFDEKFSLIRGGVEVRGPVHDVLVMAHVLDENGQGYNLETLAGIYTPMKNIKDVIGGKDERENLAALMQSDPDKVLTYVATDADATLRLFHVLRNALQKDEKLTRYYAKFILPVQDALAKTWHNGMPINQRRLREAEKTLTETIAQLREEMKRLVHPKIAEKYEDDFNFARKNLIMDVLFKHPKGFKLRPNRDYLTPKTGEPSVSEKHLKLLPTNPFIERYLKLIHAEKFLSTYVSGMWQHIRRDGRVHPDTLLTRTVTGRTVMLGPAIQTVPQRGSLAPLLKRCFVASPGWKMGARDLSQSEIRIVAWLANDQTLLTAIRNGVDVHSLTASIVNKVPIEAVTKEMRQKAKAVNFGLIYGQGAKGFQRYAKDSYGIDFTLEECERIRYEFFRGYPGLMRYHQNQRTVVKQGYVRSPLGRKRRLPGATSTDFMERGEAERQAINSPVQSFSSDLGLIGLFLFQQAIEKSKDLKGNVHIMAFIHDSIVFQAKKEVFKKAMAVLKHCMEVKSVAYIKKEFGVEVGYPVASDGKSGSDWNDMQDYRNDADLAPRELLFI